MYLVRDSSKVCGLMGSISNQQRVAILRSMLLVRSFEDRLTELVREGARVPGMQILATGQEAVVAAMLALRGDDVLVSNHRSHAHLLARGADPSKLIAEILGKATGVNKGKSGTLHLAVPEVNALMTSTVVGAGPPLALGAAFAQQYREEHNITVVAFGDGAAAEGSVHEAMNLACVWKLPLLFLCENNHWAGAQRLQTHCAGASVAARGQSYGMSAETVDGNDADAVYEATARLAVRVRSGEGPSLLELVTYRMHGHSESDAQVYVDPRELDVWAKRDPIDLYVSRLVAAGVCSNSEVETMQRETEAVVDNAVSFAEDSPEPDPEGALADVWSANVPRGV